MKKILSILAIAATIGSSLIAFDEDNTRLEAATNAVVAQNIAMPKKPVRTIAMNDEDFAHEQQEYAQFYDQLAHLAQNENVPGDEITLE